jgi:hypothetical protein
MKKIHISYSRLLKGGCMKIMTLTKVCSSTKVFCFLITALASIVLISGCSKDLSRDKAREIIINHFKYPIPVTKQLGIGSKIQAIQMSHEWLESLKHEGLIEYTPHNHPQALSRVVSVSLTDKGKKYVVGDVGIREWPNTGQKYVNVKLAEKHFIEITGINTSGDKKEAFVEYTWKYTNLSPFSKGWKDDSLFGAFAGSVGYDEKKNHEEKVHLVLYDDGWRIGK